MMPPGSERVGRMEVGGQRYGKAEEAEAMGNWGVE